MYNKYLMENTNQLKEGKLVMVSQKVIEGKKERVVNFQGRIMKVRGINENKTITVRQTLDGVEVERIFPLLSPIITKIALVEETKSKEKKATKITRRKNLHK